MKLKIFSNLQALLVIILTLILVYKIDFPRKFYNFLSLNYKERINKTYGFCSNYSAGFINYIYQKYKPEKIPRIIRYTGSRNPYWIIPDIKKKSKTDYIFIEYNNLNNIFLSNMNGNLYLPFSHKNSHKSIIDLSFKIKDIKNLERIKIFHGKSKIFEISLEDLILDNNSYYFTFPKKIKKYFKDNFFSEKDYLFEPIYVSKSVDYQIYDIRVQLQNDFNLNNFEIIDQYENCYYARKI